MREARDYGQRLRRRLDEVLRQDVLPVLGLGLGRWAAAQGLDPADDATRDELESAALTWVFRALFLLYAESAGHLPMANPTYRARSLTSIGARAAQEGEAADPSSSSMWDDVVALVKAMRGGQRAWGVPAYDGDLFSATGFAGAEILERASIPDRALAPALRALCRDRDDPDTGIDFSGLEIGHLGHIYEGLLSLRLSVADRDYAYDARADRYVSASGDQADARAGDLVWLTDEGGRKGGGVYYTPTALVRHLVRGAVAPAFAAHLERVRKIARRDPAAAAAALFDFHVLDPACGSAHFLVEVVDELADRVAALLGELALPDVALELEQLRAAAGDTYGPGVEDTALIKRLVLKRCVYGVDLSPMGAAIAKVSLWLSSFVPGLSLAYLDHNVQVGNSLLGVVDPAEVAPPTKGGTAAPLFGDTVTDAVRAAARAAGELRAIEDRTPDEVERSREAHRALRRSVADAERILDLWTAEPFGVIGARELALGLGTGDTGQDALATDHAARVAERESFLHWPLTFPQAFARERPGFDAVVGNPPWEKVTVQELEFYARYRPGLRGLAEEARRAELARLLGERPELESRLAAQQKRLVELRNVLGRASGYEGGAGDPDTYKLFCQRYRHLLRDGGSLGVVLPRSAFLAKGSAAFREWLFDRAAPRRVDFLLNTGRWAFDAEPRYTVALFVADRASAEPGHAFEVAGVADSAAAFDRQSGRAGLRISRDALGPVLEVPLLPNQAAADLLAKLRRGGPFALGAGRWMCFPISELHETNDRDLREGATTGRPLWKGRSFDQYAPHGAGARLCPATKEVLRKVEKPRPGAESLVAKKTPLAVRKRAVLRTYPRARLAFREVSRATDSRTCRACLVPPEVFLTHKAPYLAFVEDSPANEATCLAIMNSTVFDWQARRFVETNLSFFILEGLAVPVLDDATAERLAILAARLSCVDERFADFAAATGVEAGPLAPAEQDRLRAEIDALVAHAWGLTPDDLEVVFADFTIDAVPEAHRDWVRAELRRLRA
jgi:hypothetical protein